DMKPGASGRPVPGYEARSVGDDGNEAAAGETGRLMIKGDSTAGYYWNNPEKTAATMVEGWLDTGDTYVRDEEGYYHYCGRNDDMMKVGGIWCSPFEIEARLVEHAKVLEAAVVGRADDDNLIKPEAPVFIDGKYTDRGKWMDGWETRRKREAGYDWCIVRLGVTGKVSGFDLDTSFFTGNYPASASIEGCYAPDDQLENITSLNDEFIRIIGKPVRSKTLHQTLFKLFNNIANQSIEEPVIEDSTTPSEKSTPLNVLLVEDNIVNQKVASRILEKLGFKPDIANNGLEAVHEINSKDYDIILMDLLMPKLDGIETTKRIRSMLAGKKIPKIIAMTADTMMNSREACINAGMDDYLNKPINVEEIKTLMYKWQANIEKEKAICLDETKKTTLDTHIIDESNITFINEVQTKEDIDFLIEIFDIYIKELPILIVEIDNAINNNDYDKLKFFTHKLNGSALTLGIESIAEHCFAIESAATDQVVDSRVHELNAILRTHVEKVIEELKVLREKYFNLKS
ncbi:MAG: response regulator, partial [Bacteroidetes bacterium]|nr:response regulator [Bacteroidota bacterium]